MSFLQTVIGVDLPTSKSIVQNQLVIEQQKLYEQQKAAVDDFEEDYLMQIKMVLYKDNNCQIMIELDEEAESKDEAMAIASMLFQLNEGGMKTTFADIILRQTHENVEDTRFGKLIMEGWEELYKNNDEEFVIPSNVLGGEN